MNKELLEVYHFDKKIRLGSNWDGGYVICELEGNYDCYISCGVAYEASFDRDFLNKYNNIGKQNSFAFDGTIIDYPYHFTQNITFIKKNINTFNDDKNTNLHNLIEKYDNIFLSLDIEGNEYPWLLSLSQDKMNKIKQICIEFHGVCNNSWYDNYKDKIKCFEKLNKTHYITHAHNNNNGKIINGIPNVLELTYVNKNYFKKTPQKNMIPFPIYGLDFPNQPYRPDYPLAYYPFTNKNFKQIHIGNSKTNTKIIILDTKYNENTKLYFIHNYKDKFEYEFYQYQLKITRTDEHIGWGQDLIGYL